MQDNANYCLLREEIFPTTVKPMEMLFYLIYFNLIINVTYKITLIFLPNTFVTL